MTLVVVMNEGTCRLIGSGKSVWRNKSRREEVSRRKDVTPRRFEVISSYNSGSDSE